MIVGGRSEGGFRLGSAASPRRGAAKLIIVVIRQVFQTKITMKRLLKSALVAFLLLGAANVTRGQGNFEISGPFVSNVPISSTAIPTSVGIDGVPE